MRLEQYMTEGINDKGIFKAIFMAGAPGSGKTTVRSKLGGGIDPRTVNTDTWTEFFGDPPWDEKGEKIKLLTTSQLTLYIKSMLPLWCDGTSSNPTNLMAREGLLSGIGYDTGMLWINTSLESSLERAKKRHERGGRFVPEKTIISAFKQINDLKPFYKGRFKYFVEVNNDTGELTDDVIIKAYKSTGSFFSGDIINPVGRNRVEELRESGGKYLTDIEGYDENQLKRLVKAWFDK